MNIDPNSADIAGEYIYTEIEELCDSLIRGLLSDDDAIVTFRYVMALCDVLSELDEKLGKEAEELINTAFTNYPEEVLSEIQMPSWPY